MKFLALIFSCTVLFGADLSSVADKIYANETGGIRSNLISWNVGENFASLGIGHFIWYKMGEPDRFEENFPNLVKFYEKNGVKLPKILRTHKHAPWKNKAELNALKSAKNADIMELEKFLYETKNLQIEFIYERLQNSLESMLNFTSKKEHVKSQFYRVAGAPNGLYALIDYVNFKGEGINENERYNNQGWGLLQVLECTDTHSEAMSEFRKCAKSLLTARVQNSPKERGEERWLSGWLKRCETYK